MTEIFTPELLLKYLYNETTDMEHQIIATALKTDVHLNKVYTELQEGIAILDKLKYEEVNLPQENILVKR